MPTSKGELVDNSYLIHIIFVITISNVVEYRGMTKPLL